MRSAAIVLLFLALVTPIRAAEDYDRLIDQFAEGTPDKDVVASMRNLEAAGTAAFPALLAHFRDSRRANRMFAYQVSGLNSDGTPSTYWPSIGQACFDVLHGQIEGNWPRGYRFYQMLTPLNAGQWLEEHRGLSLPELRRAALLGSLRRAEGDLAKEPSGEYAGSQKKIITFLRKELEGVK